MIRKFYDANRREVPPEDAVVAIELEVNKAGGVVSERYYYPEDG